MVCISTQMSAMAPTQCRVGTATPEPMHAIYKYAYDVLFDVAVDQPWSSRSEKQSSSSVSGASKESTRDGSGEFATLLSEVAGARVLSLRSGVSPSAGS